MCKAVANKIKSFLSVFGSKSIVCYNRDLNLDKNTDYRMNNITIC